MKKLFSALAFVILALSLSACFPSASSGSSQITLTFDRGFRGINLSSIGTYGPYSYSIPSGSIQEFVISNNSSSVKNIEFGVQSADGAIDTFACIDKPCTNSRANDWEDRSNEELKGTTIKNTNQGNKNYIYAMNRTDSTQEYRIVIVAK